MAAHTGTTARTPRRRAPLAQRRELGIVAVKPRLIHVGDVHHGLGGQQLQLPQLAPLLVAQRAAARAGMP